MITCSSIADSIATAIILLSFFAWAGWVVWLVAR